MKGRGKSLCLQNVSFIWIVVIACVVQFDSQLGECPFPHDILDKAEMKKHSEL